MDSLLGGIEDAYIARFDITSLVTNMRTIPSTNIAATLFPNPNYGNFTILVSPVLTGRK